MADWEYTVTAAAKGALRNGVQRPYFDVWKCVLYTTQQTWILIYMYQ